MFTEEIDIKEFLKLQSSFVGQQKLLDKETVDLYTIFEYLIKKHKDKEKYCQKFLKVIKDYIPDIDYIEFNSIGRFSLLLRYKTTESENGTCFSNYLEFEQSKKGMLLHKPCTHSNFKIPNEAIELQKNEQLLLDEIMQYGYDNHFNESFFISCVSKLYQVRVAQNEFSILNPLCASIREYFFLSYYFYQGINFHSSKTISSSDGEFLLSTNLEQIKKLLLDSNNKDTVLEFLQNLFVYKDDLPTSFQNEFSKIKSKNYHKLDIN